TLVIPPLRERVSEIAGLARSFVDAAARDLARPPPALGPGVLVALEAYSWPGNIRELRNMIERAVLLCGGGPIDLVHLPVEKMRATFAPNRAATLDAAAAAAAVSDAAR